MVRGIPEFVDETIVISNRSTDNTVEAAEAVGVKVIEEDRAIKGIGYGYAHLSGIAAATGDLIVGADGDGTYPLDVLDRVIDQLIDGNIDVISCNRYPLFDNTSISIKLRLGVWLLNQEVRLLYGVRIRDTLSGMWVIRRSAVERLALNQGDWNLSPQVKINAVTNKELSFAEFHVNQRSRFGDSHQQYFSTGLSHAGWILKNRLIHH